MGQVDIARTIVRVTVEDCALYGLPHGKALALALLCNAWAESRLKPDAVGDNGASLGLFQLNTVAGLGRTAMQAGYPKDRLFDPVVNTTVIVWACAKRAEVRAALERGTLHDAVWAVVQYVERPADISGEVARRSTFISVLSGNRYRPDTLCSAVG